MQKAVGKILGFERTIPMWNMTSIDLFFACCLIGFKIKKSALSRLKHRAKQFRLLCFRYVRDNQQMDSIDFIHLFYTNKQTAPSVAFQHAKILPILVLSCIFLCTRVLGYNQFEWQCTSGFLVCGSTIYNPNAHEESLYCLPCFLRYASERGRKE